MTKPIQMLTLIPFDGFCDSKWSKVVDWEEEQFIEYHTNPHNGEGGPDYEGSFAQDLRLTENEYYDILFRRTSYYSTYLKIASDYVGAFSCLVQEYLGFELQLTFESMNSPKEYNFTTDRVFAHLPQKVVKGLFLLSKRNEHQALTEIIKDRHTSYDGFISFYSNDLRTWLDRPVQTWDHNEIETLITACLKIGGADSDLDNAIYDAVTDSDSIYQAWSNAVDWKAFEEDRDELRGEKGDDLCQEDPERALQIGLRPKGHDPLPMRCPDTPDLFDKHR